MFTKMASDEDVHQVRRFTSCIISQRRIFNHDGHWNFPPKRKMEVEDEEYLGGRLLYKYRQGDRAFSKFFSIITVENRNKRSESQKNETFLYLPN